MINDRIISYRVSKGLSQREFAEIIGVSDSVLCNIEKGKRTITKRTIDKICSNTKISKNWLLTGLGEMEDKLNSTGYSDLNLLLKDVLRPLIVEVLHELISHENQMIRKRGLAQ